MTFLRLPGSRPAHEGCGRYLSGISCPVAAGGGVGPVQSTLGGTRKHVRRVARTSCDRADCETCFPTWTARRAARAAEKLAEARNLYAAAGRDPGPIKHVAFSPRPEYAARVLAEKGLDGLRQLRREAWEIAELAGVKGAVSIFHPWRTRGRGPGRYRQGKNFLSPHFHFVGFGWIMDAEKFGARFPGWAYKNAGLRDSVPRTIAYLLEHAGIADGVQTLAWHGIVSNNRMKKVREESAEEALRCDCGEVCLRHPLDPRTGEVDWSRDEGVAYVKVRRRVYVLGAKGLEWARRSRPKPVRLAEAGPPSVRPAATAAAGGEL